MSVILLAWAVLFVIFARNAPHAARPKSLSEMLSVLAREPLAWALAAFYFLTFGGFVAFSIYLPTLLRDQFGLRPADAGFRTAGFVVLATLCRRDEPQVGVLLARWYNPALHDRWSTTAPVPPANGSDYKLEAKSGYLMTAADPNQPTTELEDCLSPPGQPLVHILMQKTRQGHVCEDHGYQRSRTAGFVYYSRQPGTQPLYSCYP